MWSSSSGEQVSTVNDKLGPLMTSNSPTFDEAAVETVLKETGLPLAEATTPRLLQDGLNEIALEYYWEEANPPDSGLVDTLFTFSALADSSVTPSRLKNRLVGIDRAAKRVFAGTSRRPLDEKVTELLERLGYDSKGKRLKYSGTEVCGHGGSERSAVWLCLIGAIQTTERPGKGYRSRLNERPWASLRLRETIDALSAGIQSSDYGKDDTCAAARSIHAWAEWSLPRIKSLLNPHHARHRGEVALDITLLKLGALYISVFDKRPSLSRRVMKDAGSIPNSWENFLQAVLPYIFSPDSPPEPSALQARWRRLSYTSRKNRI